MSTWKTITATALGGALLLSVAPAAAAVTRPRPTDVPGAQSAIAPDGFQVYNDYASPERTYSSERIVVHYVVLGIDAPPLNDDDADGIPDYVENVGAAADRALAYYERRGFRAPLADEAGPDSRPDVYVSRFSPGTLGVAFPAAAAAGGAFAVVANNLDPSAGRSFASVYATVAHELFHLVQFSYFGPQTQPSIPTWILEGTASALEARANPRLDDLVSAIQLRRWFSSARHSITAQSYGAQLLWRRLDADAAAAAAGALPAARRAAARGRGTPRRRRDLRPDRAGAVPAGVPPLRRLGHRRPRRRDRARVQPPPRRDASRRHRAARRALRPPGAAAPRRLLAHASPSRADADRPPRP